MLKGGGLDHKGADERREERDEGNRKKGEGLKPEMTQ
jgi:hypothetical protein